MNLLIDRVQSPIGTILVVSDGASLIALDFADRMRRMRTLLKARFGQFRVSDGEDPLDLGSRLRAYFAGEYEAIEGVPVETGGTQFQRRVWLALRTIPVGTTLTYGALAARLGKPGAARAVGLAASLNPVPIVVPCHRVIGADGTLTGYGGGLTRKRWLLAHEGCPLAMTAGRRAA
jgi:methylated-DNA-[protein]-cysteine S-methyltransferase